MENAVYLDHNATTPLLPAVVRAVSAALIVTGNPSSAHGFGRGAHRLIEDAREKVAALTGARAADVIFTSGATEANNLALRGCGRGRVLVSAVEHPSCLKAVPDAEIIPVDGNGIVDLRRLDEMLAANTEKGPAVVSVMTGNNETGVIQPIFEIAEVAHRHGALIHSDAVQAVGRIDFDIAALGVDMVSISAHKIGGPAGVGALITVPGIEIDAIICGGGHERGRRAGTENLVGIVGLGAAADVVVTEGKAEMTRLRDLRDGFETRVKNLAEGIVIYGSDVSRLDNVSCFSCPGIAGETMVMALDLAGVAVSAGSACSSGKVTASHVLAAMGVDRAEAATAIRVSLGWTSTGADIDRFVEAWKKIRNAAVSDSGAPAFAAA